MRILLFILCFAFIQCQFNSEERQALARFEAYFQAKNNQSPSKWEYQADTLSLWFEDKTQKPTLTIKGNSKKGKWAEWDEVMNSTTTYDSIWYNAAEKAIEGYFFENNDFYQLIGKPPTKTKRTYWLDSSKKISEVLIVWLPEENELSDEYLAPIIKWAQNQDSSLLKEIYPNRKIKPSAENARKWKELINQYNARGLNN